jgi:hypothetical protein
MSEAGNGSSIASNCSQVKNAFCGRKNAGARQVRGRREQQSQSSLPGIACRKTRVNALKAGRGFTALGVSAPMARRRRG